MKMISARENVKRLKMTRTTIAQSVRIRRTNQLRVTDETRVMSAVTNETCVMVTNEAKMTRENDAMSTEIEEIATTNEIETDTAMTATDTMTIIETEINDAIMTANETTKVTGATANEVTDADLDHDRVTGGNPSAGDINTILHCI